MKLIVIEHIDTVAEPVKEYNNVYIDPMGIRPAFGIKA